MDKEKNMALKNVMVDTTINGWQNILSSKIISDLFPFSVITSEERLSGKTSVLINLAARIFPTLSPNEITVIMTKDRRSLEGFKKILIERIESVIPTISAEKFFPCKYRFVTHGENLRGCYVKNVIIDDADLMDEKALYDLIINLPINEKGKIILSGASSKKGKSIWNFIINNPTYRTYKLVREVEKDSPKTNIDKNKEFEDISQKVIEKMLKDWEQKRRMKESETDFLRQLEKTETKNTKEYNGFAIIDLLDHWFFLR
nr:MAG TPA: Heat resistant RNA dependent ATPase helicase, ribosome biogenesis, atp [Caudoviricetes sp.]